ncbi:MAG TPA: peroxidase [Acidobacteriota bacterium]|nr:peroxidase [Acidobacteriota bacterium]
MFLTEIEHHHPVGEAGEGLRQLKAAGLPIPQILHLLAFKPERNKHLNLFTQAVMRGPSPLTIGQHELIAAQSPVPKTSIGDFHLDFIAYQ